MEQFAHSAWSLIPFGLMLLMIAIGPLVAEHWWEKNANKLIVSLFLGVPVAVCLIMGGMMHELEHQIFFDYVPFIILLLSLFVITGGIHFSGDLKAKPWVNTGFLGLGWILSSVMGTTGAAMLLIRPLIETNKQFMLFLRGAHFSWFMHLAPEWAVTGLVLLTIYFAMDSYYYKKEHWTSLSADAREATPLVMKGTVNFLYLLGVVLAVAFINEGTIKAMGAHDAPLWLKYLREIVLLSLTGLSLYTTKKEVRYDDNKFSWTPIIEVAVLFLGIFTTMTPALAYLKAHAADLGFTHPWQFYYATGALSAFLDNTPTAVAFHGVATGLPESLAAADAGVVTGMFEGVSFVAGIPEILLKAISIAAVMFGSLTYIGNGPNFMVKAIAEESGIKMPSFFGYMMKFSLVILLPVYIIVQLIFI